MLLSPKFLLLCLTIVQVSWARVAVPSPPLHGKIFIIAKNGLTLQNETRAVANSNGDLEVYKPRTKRGIQFTRLQKVDL